MTPDVDLPIEIIRTDRRKTASIKVRDNKVQVIVPKALSDERVRDLIRKREPWIRF